MGNCSPLSRRNELEIEADVVKCFAGHKSDDTIKFYHEAKENQQHLAIKLSERLPILGLFLSWRTDHKWYASLRIINTWSKGVEYEIDATQHKWDIIKTISYCVQWCCIGKSDFVVNNSLHSTVNLPVNLPIQNTDSPWDVQMAILSLSNRTMQISVSARATSIDSALISHVQEC